MTRTALMVPFAAAVLTACGGGPAPEPPEPVVRVDTVTITREVAPPVPEGRATTLCLASGQNAEIHISPAGDTLVGPRRVPLADLGPAIGFVGDYADDEGWFASDDPVAVGNRSFSRFGPRETRDCTELRIVGDFNGVNIFADTDAAEPFEVLYVPVRPGVFQAYRAQVGRVRG